MCDVAHVRAGVARSKRRGRVAIVKASNLKAHTPAGSLLVRGMLTELKEQLYLVYTPAYDPDANRHSHGSGVSRDEWSRIIFSGETSSFCSQM